MSSHIDLITIKYDGRTLQLRPEQLTVRYIAKAFRLIEETIILVSDRGTVAIPEDGIFRDLDMYEQWTVQGTKTSGPRAATASAVGALSLCSGGAAPKWTPHLFSRPSGSSTPETSRQVNILQFPPIAAKPTNQFTINIMRGALNRVSNKGDPTHPILPVTAIGFVIVCKMYAAYLG